MSRSARSTPRPASGSATSSGTCSPTLRLPTLLVTHDFDDAAALGARCAVVDAGRVAQLDIPSAVRAQPATAGVAALVGANLVDGVAVPSAHGARVTVAGGGTLASRTAHEGPVRVAIHPWELAIVVAEGADLCDTLVEARDEGARVIVRTTRFVVELPSGTAPPAPGQQIGLAADPSAVRLFPRDPAA